MAVLSRPFVKIVTLGAIFASSLAAPVEKLKARQDGFFPVTGPAVGGVQPRLEIRDVSANADMYNLFNLALMRFQAMDQQEKLSYFQISGIHGDPLVTWDGSTGPNGDLGSGYCPHSSNMFGPWHRPYLGLFEQILSQKAIEVANEFPSGPTKDRYLGIANELRLPYWDWAQKTSSGEPTVPQVLYEETISVTFPNSTTSVVENPLAYYRFHPIEGAGLRPPFDTSETTVRTSFQSLEEEMGFWAPDLRQSLYQLLTQYQSYNLFSNTGSGGSFIGSVESLHDGIHGTISGHMGRVPSAAFDPIFWLHHANVDRLIAIWQHLYPDTYVEPAAQWSGTWTTPAGAILDVNSDLTPFHSNEQGDYLTSVDVRFTDSMGYVYPELAGNPSNDTLKATINALYAPETTSITKRQAGVPRIAISPEQPRTYLCAIEAPHAFVGTYNVEVFLGDITTAPNEWTKDPNFVGGHSMLTLHENHHVVKGSVVLTPALQKKYSEGDLKGLETDEIVEYLKKNLHWRVQQGTDEIPREEVPNFKVTVLSTEVKPAASASDFPTYVGGFKEHSEVTAGRPGGATLL